MRVVSGMEDAGFWKISGIGQEGKRKSEVGMRNSETKKCAKVKGKVHGQKLKDGASKAKGRLKSFYTLCPLRYARTPRNLQLATSKQ
jgi:hypothetical protein